MPPSVLGKGTYGVVHKIDDRAKKTYSDRACPSAIRELTLVQSLSHPHIVKCESVEISACGIVSAIFELADHDLFEYQISKVSEELFINHVHQVLSALALVHQQGYVHGDICPGNILVFNGKNKDQASQVKLADFGATRLEGTHNAVTTTLWWRAPESLLLQQHTKAIDMWSIGAVLYGLVTGQEITTAKDDPNALHEILQVIGVDPEWSLRNYLDLSAWHYRSCNIPLPSSLKREVEWLQLLNGCLKLEAGKRLTVEQALALPLFANCPVIESGSWLVNSKLTVPEGAVVTAPFDERFRHCVQTKLAQMTKLHLATQCDHLSAYYVISALMDVTDEYPDLPNSKRIFNKRQLDKLYPLLKQANMHFALP